MELHSGDDREELTRVVGGLQRLLIGLLDRAGEQSHEPAKARSQGFRSIAEVSPPEAMR